jgi:hypothetical protein
LLALQLCYKTSKVKCKCYIILQVAANTLHFAIRLCQCLLYVDVGGSHCFLLVGAVFENNPWGQMVKKKITHTNVLSTPSLVDSHSCSISYNKIFCCWKYKNSSVIWQKILNWLAFNKIKRSMRGQKELTVNSMWHRASIMMQSDWFSVIILTITFNHDFDTEY